MNSENHNASKIYLVPNDIDGGDAAAVEQLSLEQVQELCESMLDCLATTKADGVPSLQRLVFSPETDGDGENAPPATKRRRTEEGEDTTAAKARSASMIFYSVSIEVPAGSRRTVEEIVSESLEAINSCEDQLKYLNVVSSHQQQQLNGKRQSRQIFRASKDYPQPAQSSDVTEGDKNTTDGKKSTDKNTEKFFHRPPANVKITTPFVQSPFDPAHHVPYELLVQHLIDHHSEDSLLDLEGDAAKSLLVIGCDNDRSGKKNSTTARGGGSSLPPALKKEMYGSSVGVQLQHPQGMASTGGVEAPHSVVSSTATTGTGRQQQQQVSAGLPPPSSSGGGSGLLAQPTSVQQLQQQQREREHNYPEGVNELFLGYKQTSEPPHESKVREFFSPFCAAAVVRHVRPKYCFFVMFTSPEEAQKAYRSVGRTIQLGDTALRVGWATQRPKNPPPTGDQPQQQQQLQLGAGGAGGIQHQQPSMMSGGYPPQHHQHQQQQQQQPPEQNLQQLQQLQPPLQSGPGNNTTGAPPNNNNSGSGGNFISQDVVSQSTSNTLPKNHHAGQYHEAHHRGGVVHLAHHLHPSPLGGASESANNNNSNNNNNNRNSVGMGAGGGLSPSNHHQQPQQQSAYSGGAGAQPSYPQQSAQPGLGYQQQQQMYGYHHQQHSQQQIPQQQLAGPAGTITIGGGPAGAARGGGGGGLPPLPAHLSGILNSNNGAASHQHPLQQSVQQSSSVQQQLSSSVPVNSSSSPFFVLALSQLAPSVTERSVFNRLQPFTPVSIKVVGSCAFCEFPTREAAQDALNYVQSKTLDGAPISVRLLQQ